jgi:SAM-dependent methyltransferase
VSYAEECLRLAEVDAVHRVLDVGTGPGALAFVAAPRVRHVTAIDFSPGMIAEVHKRLERESLANVTALVMDAQTLAFPDDSFDVVFSLFAFMFFPDRPRVFAEIRRVLRPGGKLVMATWASIDRRPLMKLGFDALAEALPELPPPQKGDLQTPLECEAEMRDAGFEAVSAHPFDDSLHMPSADRYLDLLVRTAAPLSALRRRLGEERWLETLSRVGQALENRIPEGGVELSAEAVLTIGRAP